MKYEKKTRAGLKLRKNNLNLNNIPKKEKIPKTVKKKKYKTNRKKDEENILSKDIDVEEEMKELERINENRAKPRDLTNINYSKNYIKNLKFRPQKYKGNYLPYHLRWIFNNAVVYT